MPYDDVSEILETLESALETDTPLEPLFWSLLSELVGYGHIRAEWYMMTPERRAERGAARTSARDAFIASCNALTRAMRERNFDTAWRASISDQRKEIGDFASYLHAVLSIQSRLFKPQSFERENILHQGLASASRQIVR